MTLQAAYDSGMKLRHHAGSTWEVLSASRTGYSIKCIVGTVRPGRIGGEVAGTVRYMHSDYLHGDDWRLENEFDAPSSRATPSVGAA